MSETKLVAYVGRGLGGSPITELADGRKYAWQRGRAYLMPAPAADRLLLEYPGQFAHADSLSEAAKRYSIKADRLAELATGGKVHGVTHQAKGEEPALVLILDELTQAGIDAEHKRAAKAKDKE
jgi:hypothetical protein